MASFAKNEVSVTQLRAIDYEFASRFSQLVTKCANEILEETDEEDVRRRALMWRMYAAPQARTAAFNQDPLAGLLELWALAGQQADYFAIGDGHSFFGDARPCVEETSAQLYGEAQDLAAEVLPPDKFPAMKNRVETWVEEHPIEGDLFVRPTAQAGLAALVGRDIEGGLKAVGNMEETLRDLNDRIAILSVQLPTEARWQADYLVRELFDDHISGPANSIANTLDRVAMFMQDFEQTLDAQTTRILGGFDNQREAMLAALDAERDLVFESLDDYQASLFDSVEDEVDETLDRMEEVGLGLIDHFFERLIGVLIGIGVFMLILTLILVGALRRGSDSRAPRSAPGAAETNEPEDDEREN